MQEKPQSHRALIATFLFFFLPFCYLAYGAIRGGMASFDIGPAYVGGALGFSSGVLFGLMFTGLGSYFLLDELLRRFRAARKHRSRLVSSTQIKDPLDGPGAP